MTNTVNIYCDKQGKWHWEVTVTHDSGESELSARGRADGYATKDEAGTAFFSLFFGSYDESFLAAYNEWDPNQNRLGA